MSSTDASTEQDASPATDAARDEIVARFAAHLGDGLLESHVVPDVDIWLRVSRESWREAAEFAKNGLGFAYFSFLGGIDWMPSPFGREMDSQIDITLGNDEASKIDQTIEQGIAGGHFKQASSGTNGVAFTNGEAVAVDDCTNSV